MFDLTGHVAIITGGNGGIGLSFAKGLMRSGASVALWGRNAQKNQNALDTLAELGEFSGTAKAYVCDVTDVYQVNSAFSRTLEDFDKVDSCFANAGGAGVRGMLHQTSPENWATVVDLNLNSVVNTFRPTIAHMLERGQGCKLIVTSSIASMRGTPFRAGYATTKAAVIGLTRSLAVEVGQQGITANALLPGYVESDLTVDTPQAFKDGAKRRACLGRVGCLEDMEGVAVFMASQHSNYMTGHGLVMDGGHTIHPI